jgi:WD40 repeat protein
MPTSKQIATDEARGIRSITLGPTSSILWTLGLVAVLFLLARATIEESPESNSERSSACRAMLTWRNHPIFAVAWSPDGRRLAASGWGPQVRLWELETGAARSIESEDGAPRFVLGWSPDSREVAVSDLEGRVESWEVAEEQGRAEARPTGPANDVRALALASRGVSIRLWGPIDGRAELLPPAARLDRAIAFTPDGGKIASGGLEGVVRVWEAESGRLEREIAMGGIGINAIAFSLDGTRLGSGGGGSARVWDVASGRELARVGGPDGGFSTLAFSPDGRRLAGASWAGRIQVWDLETGRRLANLGGNEGQVVALGWSPDGRRLASAGHDAFVRIWDLGPSQ